MNVLELIKKAMLSQGTDLTLNDPFRVTQKCSACFP